MYNVGRRYHSGREFTGFAAFQLPTILNANIVYDLVRRSQWLASAVAWNYLFSIGMACRIASHLLTG